MTLTLYELTDAYRMLLEASQAEGDEAQDESPFATALAQLEGSISDRAEGIAAVIRTLDLEADAIEAEAKRLAQRAGARRNRAAALKTYLLEQLDRVGIAKAGGTRFTVTAQASPPSVRVTDLAQVPVELCRTIPAKLEPDAKAILQRWKETGEAVPGAEVVQGRHLRIR